jgi:hypothetical protein
MASGHHPHDEQHRFCTLHTVRQSIRKLVPLGLKRKRAQYRWPNTLQLNGEIIEHAEHHDCICPSATKFEFGTTCILDENLQRERPQNLLTAL